MNKIEWELKLSVAGIKQHSLLYRSEYKGKGIQKEVHTQKNKNNFGKSEVSYFIDNDKRKFKTEEELLKILESESDG